MQFTDSHCHLDFTEFAPSLPQLLQQCWQQNIKRIIVPSVYPEHWQRVLSLSQQQSTFPSENKPTVDISSELSVNTSLSIYSSLGIHPWFVIVDEQFSQAQQPLDFYQQQLTELVANNRANIIAIGECGIDVFKAKKNTNSTQALSDNLALQQSLFTMQLTLANNENLPVIVHHCQSHHLLMPLLKKASLTKAGVIHAFSGNYQQAKSYLDLGFKLGIGGTITYPRAKKTIDAIKRVPLSSLLLETDAPSMPLHGQQGKINSPVNISEIFSTLTIIRNESKEKIAETIESNVEQLFFTDEG